MGAAGPDRLAELDAHTVSQLCVCMVQGRGGFKTKTYQDIDVCVSSMSLWSH